MPVIRHQVSKISQNWIKVKYLPTGIQQIILDKYDLVRTVEDLIEEDGEVECESQPDGMSGLHARLGDVECVLVRLLAVLHHRLLVTPNGYLSQISTRK